MRAGSGSGSLLARAVRALTAAPDPTRALTDLAELLVPDHAQWCLADLLQPPDMVSRVVALGVAGPLPLPPDGGGPGARRSSAQAVGLLPRLLDAPGRVLRLGPDDVERLGASDEPRLRSQAQLARSAGVTQVLVLGLVNRDELLGVLTLGRSDRAYADDEVELLTDVASLAALALDGLRLRELQRGVSTALQRSLLPRLPVVPGLSLAARFSPAGGGLAVGGDWYDVFAVRGSEVALVVGDATGHDVQAAARMAELRNLLRAVAVDTRGRPAGALSRLDRIMAQLSPELSGTCVYAQLDPAPGRAQLTWSSAGHLPPVLLRDGRASLLETPPDLMLGVRPGTVREDHTMYLGAGDVLVLYTDGLVEDRLTGLDERLGALMATAASVGGEDLEALADALVEQVPTGDDDVAVLVARVDT